MNTLTISALLILVNMCVALFSLNGVNATGLNQQEYILRSKYDLMMKNQIENVMSILDHYNKRVEAGELTLDEAKRQAADLIRDIRYENDLYFWIDTSNGDNVVLYGSEAEGSNRMDSVDALGDPLVKNIITAALNGGGYTDYYFPRAGSAEPLPKRGYSEYFQPFDWVVGTGNYIDDIDVFIAESATAMHSANTSLMLIMIAVGATLLLIAALSSNSLSNRIANPINRLSEIADSIAKGNLNINSEIPQRSGRYFWRFNRKFFYCY